MWDRMTTDWERVAAEHRRRQREDRSTLCSYGEVCFWRRRARVWRVLFWLAVLVLLIFARK